MVSPSRKRHSSISANRDERIVAELCTWFDATHRELPFRQGKNAYGTWVSEIMLQQTQVKTVIPYFERWMRRFPNVSTLATASEAEVLSVWQGLGYYSRARNLHRAAKLIVAEHGARLPNTPTELLRLPGIGRYTAGAIVSIAYDRPEPIVDGNVIRVLTRLDALHGDPRKQPLSEALWARAKALVESSDPSRFNQGLMELGALVCTPKNPTCSLCPLLKHCRGHTEGLVARLPELPKRAKAETRRVIVLYARRSTGVFLRHQPEGATHWAKLFVLPYVETKAQSAAARLEDARTYANTLSSRARVIDEHPITTLRYPITRFRFEADVYAVTGITAGNASGRYYSVTDTKNLALPAPHRRLLTKLTKAD